MSIAEAMSAAMATSGWNVLRIAYEANANQRTVEYWVQGKYQPSADTLELLRAKWPEFRASLNERTKDIWVEDKVA